MTFLRACWARWSMTGAVGVRRGRLLAAVTRAPAVVQVVALVAVRSCPPAPLLAPLWLAVVVGVVVVLQMLGPPHPHPLQPAAGGPFVSTLGAAWPSAR